MSSRMTGRARYDNLRIPGVQTEWIVGEPGQPITQRFTLGGRWAQIRRVLPQGARYVCEIDTGLAFTLEDEAAAQRFARRWLDARDDLARGAVIHSAIAYAPELEW